MEQINDDCRLALNMLLESVNLYREHENSCFYQCTLDGHYILPNASVVTDENFESGVVKIQRGQLRELTE